MRIRIGNGPSSQKRGSISFVDFILNYLVIIAILLLLLITVIVEPKVLSVQNISNIINQFSGLSMVALGMTLVIIGGFIDLSVVGVINLTAISTIMLIQPLGQLPAFLLGLALGTVLGWLNSKVILSCGATTKHTALFVTYGLSSVYSAIAMIICKGETQNMAFITRDKHIFTFIGQGKVGILSISFLLFLAFMLALHIFHKRTYMGRAISLSGSNKTAAMLAGIPVNRSISLIFTLSGLMSAFAAIVLFSRVTVAQAVIGNGFDMNAILSVVVGGTPLIGGKGSVLRTFLGVLLVTLLSNCLDLLGVNPYMKVLLTGAILVVSIWLDNRKEQRGASR